MNGQGKRGVAVGQIVDGGAGTGWLYRATGTRQALGPSLVSLKRQHMKSLQLYF
jgi:hypothetical protein